MWEIKVKKSTYLIERDTHQFILYKQQKVKDNTSKNYGEYTKVNQGYFQDLEGIAWKLFNLEMITKEEKGELKTLFQQAIQDIKQSIEVIKHG